MSKKGNRLESGDIELADIQPGGLRRKSVVENDDEKLRKMGYEPQLHRGFSSVMAFCFCFTSVAVVSSISGLFSTGMAQGGPVIIIWSWIIGSFLTIIVSCSMAELCSTYPSAGSVYHWAGNLASERWGPLLAYITGWFNFLGNAAGVAFYGYTFAASIAAVVKKNGFFGDPDSEETEDMSVTGQTFIAIGVFVLWTLQNLLRIDYQGYINNFATFWQIVSTIGIVITLFVTCPQSGTASWNVSNDANTTDTTEATVSMATAAQVFGEWYNDTGFDDAPGYVVWIGALFVSFCLTGYEAAGHMSEETAGADTSGPSSMINTVILSALTGFLYLLGLLFATAHRVKDFVDNEEDVTDIFSQCSGPVGGNILASALIVNVYFSGYSSFTVTARTAFAMARDKCFPGSGWIGYVSTSASKAPLGSIALVLLMSVVLISLNWLSKTAFVAVTALTVIGYQISYLIPILLRVTVAKSSFRQSQWSLGNWSIAFGWISFLVLFITSIACFAPAAWPVVIDPSSDDNNMNWTGVVVGFVLFIMFLHWSIFGQFHFKGPQRDDRNGRRSSIGIHL